jgi:O-antigen/teichoic acid export membrane protein
MSIGTDYRAKLASLIDLLKTKPFDVLTEEGRGRERLRRIALTTGTSFAARLLTSLIPFVTIPLTLKYLGNERYGLWMTITTFTSFLAFSDLGLGNGLLTAISQANGEDDREKARRCVASTFYIFMLMGVVISGVYWLACPYIPWGLVFNATSSETTKDAQSIATVIILCFALGIPLGVVQRVQAGYQDGFQSNLWQCASSFVGMLAVIAAIKAQVPVSILVLVYTLVPLVVTALNGVYYFSFQRKFLTPTISHFHWPTAKGLLAKGIYFLFLSILTAVGLNADNLIIAHTKGLDSVAGFSVALKLASILSLIPAFIYQPLWSANGEALARGDLGWVFSTMKRAQRLGLILCSAAAVLMVGLGVPLVPFWLGPQVEVSYLTLSGLTAISVMFAFAGPMFMVLNSCGRVLPQIAIFSVFFLVSIAFKIGAIKYIGLWTIGWVGALLYLTIVVIPLHFYVAQVKDDLSKERWTATLKDTTREGA